LARMVAGSPGPVAADWVVVVVIEVILERV
jgi:hypothetical protein